MTAKERRQAKNQQKQRKREKQNFSSQWLGILPLAFKLFIKKD